MGNVAERLPHVHHRQPYAFRLVFPEPVVKLAHAGLRAVFAAEPDRPAADQVTDHDAVGMSLADRDLVDPDRLGTGLARTFELGTHVLHLQLLDRMPVELQFPGHGPESSPCAPAGPRKRQSASCTAGCRQENPAVRASPCRSFGRRRAESPVPDRRGCRRTTGRAPGEACGCTSPSARVRRHRSVFF